MKVLQSRILGLVQRTMGSKTRPTRPLLPILPFFLTFQLTHACLIALSPRRPGRLFGTLALVALVVLAYRCTTGDVQHDCYMGNSLMTQALPVLLLNWLTDPVHDFRHERDPCAPAALSFPRRVWWALCVLNSPRGVGWSYEVRIQVVTLGTHEQPRVDLCSRRSRTCRSGRASRDGHSF